MTRKLLYLLSALLSLFSPICAQQVSPETALRVAGIFMQNNMPAATRNASAIKVTTNSASVVKPMGKISQSPVMYAVSQDSMWVLVAADERVTPILAYSDANAGTFPEENDMPDGMIALLEWYEQQIQFLRDSTNLTTSHKGWKRYQIIPDSLVLEAVVSPLLYRDGKENIWNQSGLNGGGATADKCYNKFCPLYHDGRKTIVGCVAVAMGQLMWYWQWPEIAVVEDDNENTLIREYNWDYMPAELRDTTPVEHVDMVANLLHDVGVSVNMNYGPSGEGGSSASPSRIPNALKETFSYNSDELVYRDDYAALWLSKLKRNLNNGYPILYGGRSSRGGHRFIVDGYNSDDAFHINYGWGGSQNGYYILETIVDQPFEFYSSQSAVLNVYPNYPDCAPREVSQNEMLDSKFAIQNGGGITISNTTIESNQEGVIYSGEYIKLTNGFHAALGCNLHIAVKDVHCEDSQSVFSLPKRTTYEGTVKDWCNQWNILSYSYLGAYNPLAGAITYKYVFGKDILINDKTYVELMRYSTTDTTEMGTYICALRFTENKKVYIHYDNAEYLLYDFDVQIGDTLELFAGIQYYKHQKTYTHTVTNIDTLDNGKAQITLDAILLTEQGNNIVHEERFPKTWIEGLGSIDGIVHNNATLLEGGGISVLLCAYHNDECRYTTDNPYYTPLGCIYNEGDIIDAVESVIAPAPSTQKIIYNGQLFILRDGKTYNAMGIEVEK